MLNEESEGFLVFLSRHLCDRSGPRAVILEHPQGGLRGMQRCGPGLESPEGPKAVVVGE